MLCVDGYVVILCRSIRICRSKIEAHNLLERFVPTAIAQFSCDVQIVFLKKGNALTCTSFRSLYCPEKKWEYPNLEVVHPGTLRQVVSGQVGRPRAQNLSRRRPHGYFRDSFGIVVVPPARRTVVCGEWGEIKGRANGMSPVPVHNGVYGMNRSGMCAWR